MSVQLFLLGSIGHSMKLEAYLSAQRYISLSWRLPDGSVLHVMPGSNPIACVIAFVMLTML